MIALFRFAPPTFGVPWFDSAPVTRNRCETSESLREDHELPRENVPCCGGYNEALIVQYWTSYNPHH